MTTPPTKEAAFKQRFAAVLADLHQDGVKDPEAMALLGHLSSDLAANMEQHNWSAAKAVMTPAVYDALLESFERRGNQYYKSGHKKHAYALQVLIVSLVASTQRGDAQMAEGEKLIDTIIDRTIALHRQGQPTPH